jgi:hypothetical protein
MNLLGETAGEAELEKILSEQQAAIDCCSAAAQAAMDAAEKVAVLALEANYGPEETDRIMDRLTDREIRAIVDTVETGAMPKDFFPSPGTPPKSNSTPDSGSGPGNSSSPQDSRDRTSKTE